MSISIDLRLLLLQNETADHVSTVLRRVSKKIKVSPNPERPLHGSARTTREQRKKIKDSHLSVRALAKEHHIDPKTVRRWKASDSVEDEKMGPRFGQVRAVSEKELIQIREFLIADGLTLDAALAKLNQDIPHLTRSTLGRIRRSLQQAKSITPPSNQTANEVLQEIIKIGAGKESDVLIRGISRG